MSDFNLFSISKGLWETIYNLITNWIYLRINTILSFFVNIIPDPYQFNSMLSSFFDTITEYVVYALDASFILPQILSYLIISAIFAVSSKIIVYLIKLIVKWWHFLAP